ncbi:SAM-dependent methyltransferase [Streptomyces johnsoniae]|uniref:Methyltransferase domain-containing protein n=1 Tax=Streptomyces johnsoniae TaxID=3075532 RepID=A0ABU2S210_9ACTN|nr:methyltransferase domain-containing protein [Streptomyces sp. DSM 41886]MDT0443012.1 methyltransferase domain-containing protein [Streptomyces sp. DSM 41886]
MTTDIVTTYLLTNRAFAAPAIEEAIRSLDLGGRRRLLDAGTGAGGGLVALARAADPDARVLGVDQNADALELAAAYAEKEGVADRVETRRADLLEVLAETVRSGAGFDVIWASDVIWPGNFPDPEAAVAALAGALNPGGVLALFSSGYYQATFLPGHSWMQQRLRVASQLNWSLPGEGPTQNERLVHWTLAAGLREPRVRLIPRVVFPLEEDPTARPYLERVVWPELLDAARERGREAGMSEEELVRAAALMTPGDDGYVLNEPGYHLLHPMLLVTGKREGEPGAPGLSAVEDADLRDAGGSAGTDHTAAQTRLLGQRSQR